MTDDMPRRFRDWTISLPPCLLAVVTLHGEAAQTRDEVTPEVQNLYAEARAARERGEIPAAIDKYRQMIKLAPHLAAAYNNLGMLYFDTHDYKNAVEVLRRGLELDPNMPSTEAMLGTSYFQLGDQGNAQPLLQRTLKAIPTTTRWEWCSSTS